MKRSFSERLLMSTALAGVLSLAGTPQAYANPIGGQVVGGQANISSSGNTLTVQQTTSRAIINWSSFDIAPGEITQFEQPSSSSIALNRVTGSQNPSQILGTLNANGQVWIINPNGVMFGGNAQVNVAGLVATSADIDNNNFMAGNYTFNHPGNANAVICNAGSITIADAGLVAFVAPNVSNAGVINARLGKVQLGSGDTFALDLYGDGLISLAASPAVTQQLVANSGTIQANGGQVMLTAAAAQNTINSLINNTGVIEAQSIGTQNGQIVLYAAGSNAVANNDAASKGQQSGASEVLNSGTLDASGYGSGETGGSISVLGDNVGILSGSTIDASGDAGGGYIKIGGDFHGAGTTPTALDTVVQSGSLISADALTSGNGGSVAVWADNYTDFAGTISAHGGATSGNGGYVETSGHVLDATGYVNASAQHGTAGQWLLDPADLTIDNGSGSETNVSSSGANPITWQIGGGTTTNSYLNAATIDSELNAGTSVIIQTTNTGSGGNGDIFVNNAISATTGTSGVTGNLTLSAYRNIVVNDSITLGGTGVIGGALTLRADNAANSNGYINVEANISTFGGNITMGGQSGAITAGVLNANGTINTAASGYATDNTHGKAGIIINNAIVDAGGGNIIMNGKGTSNGSGGSGGVTIGFSSAGTVKTFGAGNISISGIYSGGAIGLYDSSSIKVSNGAITLIGAADSAATDGQDFGIALNGGSISATGTGTITINATGGGTQSNENDGIDISGGTISTTSGALTILGTGGNGVGGHNSGVDIDSGGIVTSTSGNISITGIAGADSSGYSFFTDGTTGNAIGTSGATTGNITLNMNDNTIGNLALYTTGTVAFAPNAASTNIGVANSSYGLNITSSLLGDINSNVSDIIIGATGDTGTMNVSAYTWSNPLTLISGSGVITIAGAQAMGSNNFTMETNHTPTMSSTVTTSGLLTVETSGSTTLGVGTNASGTVNLSDTALGDLTGASYQFGSTATGNVDINTGSSIANKNLTFISGGTIYIDKSGDTSPTALTDSGSSTTTLTFEAGTDIVTAGAITASGTGAMNVLMDSDTANGGGAISIGGNITTNGGNITMGGNESNPANIVAGTGFAVGDATKGNGITLLDAQLQSGAGQIIMNGYSNGAFGSVYGVYIDANSVVQTGSGNMYIDGHGFNTGSSGTGVWSLGQIIVNSGDMSIIGYGSTSGSSSEYGVGLWGGTTETTGTGTITITGYGGGAHANNHGVVTVGTVESTAVGGGSITITGTSGPINASNLSSNGIQLWGPVTSVDGNITLNGTSTASNTTNGEGVYFSAPVSTSGAGNIYVTGTYTSATSYGVEVTVTNGIQTTGTGAISLTANSLDFTASNAVNGVANVAIAPSTVSTAIGVANDSETLNIDSGILGGITAGSLTIGNSSDTGPMTLSAYSSSAQPTSFVTGNSGSITVSGNQTATGNGSFSFTGPTTLSANLTTANQNITFNSAVTLGASDTLNAGSGTLTFGSTVNGAYDLVATAGTFSFASALGGTTPLSAVSLISTNGLTLPSITASSITAQTTGTSADIIIPSGKALTASGSGTAITLASGRNFINGAGSGALAASFGDWLIYSTNPSHNTLDGITGNYSRYSCTYGGSCPAHRHRQRPTLQQHPGLDRHADDTVSDGSWHVQSYFPARPSPGTEPID